ncbi:UvrD-helicase domain-containing protein [Candidatus Saccharibacteria bacterium]|nr:UvrD-helicase domain-containing protein [Candidatus Saccharibacteria bacterium]
MPKQKSKNLDLITLYTKPLAALTTLFNNTEYISHTDLQTTLKPFKSLNLSRSHILKLSLLHLKKLQPRQALTLLKTTHQIKKFLARRDHHNKNFITREQQKPHVYTNHALDSQQIEAIVACEDATLVLASAGSGKTLTLLAKITYLHDHLKIPAHEILAISFTKKTVQELKQRISLKNVQVHTFHSLGNKILRESSTQTPTLADETEIRKLLKSTLDHHIKTNKSYTPKYTDFTHSTTDTPAFDDLVHTFLLLQKNANLSLADVQHRIESIRGPSLRLHAKTFLDLYSPIYRTYQKHLKSTNQIDFADMINSATKILKTKTPTTFSNLKYILIDEVQDLSLNRYKLIRTLLDQNPTAKLFAVGDDWQSIYRFAGSDLSLIQDFERTFARKTHHTTIESTYRFGSPTTRISSNFILKNPSQSRKKVTSPSQKQTSIEIHLHSSQTPQSNSPHPEAQKVHEILTSLHDQIDLSSQQIQIISRYNQDIETVLGNKQKKIPNHPAFQKLTTKNPKSAPSNKEISIKWYAHPRAKPIHLAFCSIHKAKGITRDIVIVLNMNSKNKSMPASQSNNSITELLLAHPNPYPHAEERRLFYVAITRARRATYLIANQKHPSSFLLEISPDLAREFSAP